MDLNTFEADSIELLLRQMGATEIKKVRGILYFIEFEIDEDLEVSYCYNVNKKGKYFLQRINPYPISEGVFETEIEVVSFITKDLKKFKNAKNSRNFKTFLEVTNKVNKMTDTIEYLFLNYNVEGKDLDKLNHEIDDINLTVEQIEKNAKEL
ncbi:hypothetical protein EXD82_02570 [Peptacetobacter hominis]|uniref:Uncharacterized protein n=1 Tax=Peptacetobacter hominis TaxID=2743610 RepID=A0A544QX57_9FIRM|nr:hypothetical protein [Peptacetobacter hominis]TQQ85299.1 hypothetical protein EXD82_02570 [Peptacetobacter hominis]